MTVFILKMRAWEEGLRGQESLVLTHPDPGRSGGRMPGQGLTDSGGHGEGRRPVPCIWVGGESVPGHMVLGPLATGCPSLILWHQPCPWFRVLSTFSFSFSLCYRH